MANTQHNTAEQHRNGLSVTDDAAVLVKFNGFYGLVPMPVVPGVTKEQSDAINGFRLSRVQTKGQGVINKAVKDKLDRAAVQAKLNAFCESFDLAAALSEGGESKDSGRSRDTLRDLRIGTEHVKSILTAAAAKAGKTFAGPEAYRNTAEGYIDRIMARPDDAAKINAEVAAFIAAGYTVSAKGAGGARAQAEDLGDLEI